jgi:hypothetical protein
MMSYYTLRSDASFGAGHPGDSGNAPTGLSFNKQDATVPPTVNDDQTLGFRRGSKWLIPATGAYYECSDDTIGAAVWLGIGSGAGPAGSTARVIAAGHDTEFAVQSATNLLEFTIPDTITGLSQLELSALLLTNTPSAGDIACRCFFKCPGSADETLSLPVNCPDGTMVVLNAKFLLYQAAGGEIYASVIDQSITVDGIKYSLEPSTDPIDAVEIAAGAVLDFGITSDIEAPGDTFTKVTSSALFTPGVA